MNKERLLKLADFVEANAVDNKFNMTTFFSRKVMNIEDLRKVMNIEDLRNQCSTTACLAGWGCLIPEFKRDGYVAKLYDVTRPELGIVPSYNGNIMFEALVDFFDLSYEQAYYLFGEYSDTEETKPRNDDGVELAVSRIRDFVATDKVKWEAPDCNDDEEF